LFWIRERNERTVPPFHDEGKENMHIAVCDDNLADRHQMERLLGRESDKQKDTSELLVVDSFGNPEKMLAHPKAYDLVFIDICNTEGMDAVKVANELLEKGVHAPIVMCVSSIDYRQSEGLPENTLFLDKPIKVAELHDMIEKAKVVKNEMPDQIELRKVMDTVYVNVDDIIYAREKSEKTHVILTTGEELTSHEPLWLFKRSLGSKHPEFIFATPMVLVNAKRIQGWGPLSTVIMEGGKRFHVARQSKDEIKKYTGESNT